MIHNILVGEAWHAIRYQSGMTKRELYYSLRSAYRLSVREFVHEGKTLVQPMNLLGVLRKLTGDWFAGLGRPGYWSDYFESYRFGRDGIRVRARLVVTLAFQRWIKTH